MNKPPNKPFETVLASLNLPVMLPIVLSAMLLLPGTAAAAAPNEDFVDYKNEEFDHQQSEDDVWREQAFEIPAPPTEDRLEIVDFDKAPAGLEFYADPDAFEIGDDRVTRYWLFTRSKRGGPYNATYFGLRCETLEINAYAVAVPGREQPIRNHPRPRWRPLRQYGVEMEMGKYFFCVDRFQLDADQIARNIRHGVNLTPRAFVDVHN